MKGTLRYLEQVHCARKRAGKPLTAELRFAIKDQCPTCIKYKGQMHPTHFGSKNCKSGSLASPHGVSSHCTCDVCF